MVVGLQELFAENSGH